MHPFKGGSATGNPRYQVAANGDFVIDDFNEAPSFASFLPGIAGVWGVPLWSFYANRGQCMASFGVLDKDGAIMEFHPANKAYRLTALHGFRTFIKSGGASWEPFAEGSGNPARMMITSHDLRLEQRNRTLGLLVAVEYFTLPGEGLPALVRVVRITNESRKAHSIEALDGMPCILPAGVDNGVLKTMSNVIQAWLMVEPLGRGTEYYRTKTALGDSAMAGAAFRKGNFYSAFVMKGGRTTRPAVVVKPTSVFGPVDGLESPVLFLAKGRFTPPAREPREGFFPCAFAHVPLNLRAGESAEIVSLIGQAEGPGLVQAAVRRVMATGYVERKRRENRELIGGISGMGRISSASPELDAYVRQNFLDNVLRGGLPVDLAGRPFYVYYRAHGDMEREYNDFKVVPSFASEGNGNYRDINQNRRCDNFFNPDIGGDNIIRFVSLLQLDGFNPLVVKGGALVLADGARARSLLRRHLGPGGEDMAGQLAKPFLLGTILKRVEDRGIKYRTSRVDLARDLMDTATWSEESVFSTGYWADHWFYNTDLLESFEGIHPERVPDLLHRKACTYYDTDRYVAGRDDKYFVRDGRMWQLEAVREDAAKRKLIDSRKADRNFVRSGMGKGPVYRTTLASKLLCLAANKAASLDAHGIGMEMESEKPDWCDAMNGLPGRFGSSLSQTIELKRLCLWLAGHLSAGDSIALPVEAYDLFTGVRAEAKKRLAKGNPFAYWDRTYAHKERFRGKTRMGVSGRERVISGSDARSALESFAAICDLGINAGLRKYGTYITYFMNEPVKWRPISGTDRARIKAFRQIPLPLYLEGFVHALRTERDPRIPKWVRNGPLYDRVLGMYKVNAPLGNTTTEIGRAKTFPRGWLENESIWLHMEYKYLLEVLRAGFYDDFFRDFRKACVAFMDPAIYRRSITENSSFIASSCYPDPVQHGRGFVARLSGATAEFVDIMLRMTCGKNPFFLDNAGRLRFRLSPVLPSWLFKDGKFGFTFLGKIEVVVINRQGIDTWKGLRVVSYRLEGRGISETIRGGSVSEPWASLVRDRKVEKITVELG